MFLDTFPYFSSRVYGPYRSFGSSLLFVLRPFVVDCSSRRPSKRRTFDFKARERRRVDGKWRRLRTVRWALACLPMRSPSSSFWRYKGTEKISYYKTFRPKNAAKIENYFGQTEFYQGFHRFLYNGWYNLQNVLKHATPITVLQLQFFSRRGSKTWMKILYYIYIYIYNIIIITCVILDRG